MRKCRGLVLLGMLAGAWVRVTGQTPGTALPEVAPRQGWDSLPAFTADADSWPLWRGLNQDNLAPEGQTPPSRWAEGTGIVWQVRLKGVGHSSPCILAGRIYLTAAEKNAGRVTLRLFCLDRVTGATVWQSDLYDGPAPKQHPDNAAASATPACDGERVFVPYQTDREVVIAAASAEDGKPRWRQPVAPYNTVQGFSASPTFYRSAVVLPVEGPKGSYLTAFHRATGEVVWRTRLRDVQEGYAPAVVARVANRLQLLQVGGTCTRGFDPDTGRLLWFCEGPAKRVCVATAVFDRDTVYATGGYPNRKLMAVRAGGRDDVTASHMRWSSDAKAGYVPSPVLRDGLLYAVVDQGLMRCYDTADGRVLWERDFKVPFYSSPTVAGNRIYLFDRKGKGYIIPTGREPGAILTNALPSGVFATPVILGSRIYLRTLGDLYCLGER